jgi:Flp pilus assembly protein TadG
MSRSSNKPKVKPVSAQPTGAPIIEDEIQDSIDPVDVTNVESSAVETADTAEDSSNNEPAAEVTGAEPTPAAPVVTTPVAAVTPKEEPPSEPTTVHEFFKLRYPNMTEVPTGVQAVINTLDAYNHTMHPTRPIDSRAAVQYQRALHYAFLSALGLPGRQSQLALEAILWYFHNGRDGSFSQYLIFRPIPARAMSPAEISSLRMLLHLFYNTSDPTTRKANLRSMVDIRKILETLPSPKARESLLNFYA